jgi:universal stress protein A
VTRRGYRPSGEIKRSETDKSVKKRDREGNMFKPTKILVPTDFSEYSDKALQQALDIAKQHHSQVYLLHVIHSEIHRCHVDYCLSDEQIEQFKKQMADGAYEALKKQVDKFPESKEVEVAADVKQGAPYEAILKEEQEKGIDLIVIAPRGRTGITKYHMGGIALNVLKGAKCPVLLAK